MKSKINHTWLRRVMIISVMLLMASLIMYLTKRSQRVLEPQEIVSLVERMRQEEWKKCDGNDPVVHLKRLVRINGPLSGGDQAKIEHKIAQCNSSKKFDAERKAATEALAPVTDAQLSVLSDLERDKAQ